MDKITTVLVPFNFSKASVRALEYAVDFIRIDKTMKIILVYVTEEQQADKAKENFEATVKKYDIKDRIEWVRTSGPLTAALLKMQKEQKVDMVIMGTSGVAEESLLSKTNTSQLVLEADFPVLVIPKDAKKFNIKHIALVLGKEKIEDTETLQTLLDLSRRFNAKVHVLTIENKPESYGYSNIDVENENTLAYYLESFYVDHTFIRNPDVIEGIFSYVSKKDIDVITILPRNHIKMGEPSEGQLTQMLTLHSKVPILAID